MAICAKQTFHKEYGTVRKTDPILHSCPSVGKHVNELYDAGTPCMFELLELRLRVVHGNMAIGRWLAWGCGLLGKHKKSGEYRVSDHVSDIVYCERPYLTARLGDKNYSSNMPQSPLNVTT